MYESSEELVQRILGLLQAEIKIHLETPIIDKIISSAHHRKECDDLSGQEISGQKLAYILTSEHIAKAVGGFGIRISGLTILDKFDLDSVKIEFPLVFKDCLFKDDIILRDARTKYLSFEGCQCRYINASRLIVDGSLWLNRGFSATQGIELNNAQINGNIDLSGATIEPIQEKTFYRGKSLVLDCAIIGGNLWLSSNNQKKPFTSRGEISLVGATIKGSFICRAAKLKSDETFLDKNYDKALALRADSATVTGIIEFSHGFAAEGQMLLMNMDVRGDVKCEGGKFSHSPLSHGFQADDSHRHAISFDRSIIGGSIFLRDGFEATGQVRLIGTTIKNDLDCSGGSFLLSPHATDCYTVFIVRSLIQSDAGFCKTQLGRDGNRNFETNGVIYLNSVRIGNSLDLTRGVEFNKNHRNENGLRAHNCNIGGWIKFRNLLPNEQTVISLSGTTSGGLDHNWNVFLTKNSIKKLSIDRFVYERYECRNDDGSLNDSMEWLTLLDKTDASCTDKEKSALLNASLGCYQQLANVLIKNGRRPEAVDILIKMEERKFSKRGRFWRMMSWILSHGIGFGYHPQKALIFAVVYIFFSAFIFREGNMQKVFYPSNVAVAEKQNYISDGKEPPLYPGFNALAFSAETFFPVLGIDFGVKKNWDINNRAKPSGPVKFPSGCFIYYYSWLHKFLGWIISTLIVGGFTAYFIRKY